MLDLQQLHTFIMVVATKSFTQAAVKLGYSQSTVTFHIKAIEKELGVQLIDRYRFSRRIKLTAEGRRAHEYALKLVRMAEGVKAKLNADKGPRAPAA